MAEYDRDRLAALVRDRVRQTGLNQRAAAAAARVPAPQLSRARSGHILGAANFLLICDWLCVDPYTLIIDPAAPADRQQGDVSPDVSRETAGETHG